MGGRVGLAAKLQSRMYASTKAGPAKQVPIGLRRAGGGVWSGKPSYVTTLSLLSSLYAPQHAFTGMQYRRDDPGCEPVAVIVRPVGSTIDAPWNLTGLVHRGKGIMLIRLHVCTLK